jgi:hypothetical protein
MKNAGDLRGWAVAACLLACMAGPVPAEEQPCPSDSIYNYYPAAQVERIFSYPVLRTSGELGYHCNDGTASFFFELPTGLKAEDGTPVTYRYHVTASLRKDGNPREAGEHYQNRTADPFAKLPASFQKAVPAQTRKPLKLGDEAVLIGESAPAKNGKQVLYKYRGVARQGRATYQVEADVVVPDKIGSLQHVLQAGQVAPKVEELLALAMGGKRPVIPGSPPPSTPETKGRPVVQSIHPSSVSAGVRSGFDQKIGLVSFRNNEIGDFTITGENLQGVKVDLENKGLDGQPGILLYGIKVSPDGKTAVLEMTVRPEAREGAATLLLTGPTNLSATHDLTVTITGNQYLDRKFARDSVSFYGEWPEIAPTPDVQVVENAVRLGLQTISKPAYRPLQIQVSMYEKKYWDDFARKKFCGDNRDIVGCSSGGDRGMHIGTRPDIGDKRYTEETYIASTIVHEAAHKLYMSHMGAYWPVPSKKNNFLSEWISAAGDVSPRACSFLPRKSVYQWADGTSVIPRCGFPTAYASLEAEPPFQEDVSTMTDCSLFPPGHFQAGDGPTDPRYKLKRDLLVKYGFL